MAEKEDFEVTGTDIITTPKVDDYLSLVERNVAGYDKIMKAAMTKTRESDWLNWNGKPRLTSGTALKMARPFGLKVPAPTVKKIWTEDEKEKYYFYQVEGIAELPGGYGSVYAVGTCSERDEFFSMRFGERRQRSEVDETDILKAAVSNFYVNVIMALFGIKDVTMDDLKEYGLDPSKIKGIKFKKGEDEESPSAPLANGNLADKIRKMLLEIVGGDEKKAKNRLEQLTTFADKKDGKETGKMVPGKRTVRELSQKALEITYRKVETLHKKWQKEQGGESKKGPPPGEPSFPIGPTGKDDKDKDGIDFKANVVAIVKEAGINMALLPLDFTDKEGNTIIDLRGSPKEIEAALDKMRERRKND